MLTKEAIRAINREEKRYVGYPRAEEVPEEPDADVADVCQKVVRCTGVGVACYAYRQIAGELLSDPEAEEADDPEVQERALAAFNATRWDRGLYTEEELAAGGVDLTQCDDMKDGIYRIRGGGGGGAGGRPRKDEDPIITSIKALQKHGELLVPKVAIRRLVREVLDETLVEFGLDGRWVVHYEAHHAIQEAVENFATELFQDAVLGTVHAKRRTTQLKDMKLVGQMRGIAKRADRDDYLAHPNPKVEDNRKIEWTFGKKSS
jgi:histone H3/H4